MTELKFFNDTEHLYAIMHGYQWYILELDIYVEVTALSSLY